MYSYRLFLAAAVLIGLSAHAEFRAACVQVDITPETPQWLHGYAPRQSTGVHDKLYHRIAALDDGATTFYLVASDICTVSPSWYDAMTRQLEAETGIKREQIWWSTTHTHSGPHVGPQELRQELVSLAIEVRGERGRNAELILSHDPKSLHDAWQGSSPAPLGGPGTGPRSLEKCSAGHLGGPCFAGPPAPIQLN